MKEIRWHARAGQGAKTASQLLATALLRSGKSVQAFPEYGPERRGAPLRAYTRFDEQPIRRHDSVRSPTSSSCSSRRSCEEAGIVDGVCAETASCSSTPTRQPTSASSAFPLRGVSAERGSKFVNLVMARRARRGARRAAARGGAGRRGRGLLGRKVAAPRRSAAAVEEGYAWLS